MASSVLYFGDEVTLDYLVLRIVSLTKTFLNVFANQKNKVLNEVNITNTVGIVMEVCITI